MNFKTLLNIPKRLREGEKAKIDLAMLRITIEKAIQIQTDMIADCEIEKKKYQTDIKRFCQIWSAQKDHQKNVEMLKDLL